MSYGFVVESRRGQARSCIIARLCKEIRPKDLRLIPGELFTQENVRRSEERRVGKECVP